MCDQEQESATHITLTCVFAREIWFCLRGRNDSAYRIAEVSVWWSKHCSSPRTKLAIDDRLMVSAYIAWNPWKDRNRRVFEQKEKTTSSPASLISDEVDMVVEATRKVFGAES